MGRKSWSHHRQTGPFFAGDSSDEEHPLPRPRRPPRQGVNAFVRVFWLIDDGIRFVRSCYRFVRGCYRVTRNTSVWAHQHRYELAPLVTGAAVFLAGLEMYAQQNLPLSVLETLAPGALGWSIADRRYGRERKDSDKHLPPKLVYARWLLASITGWLLAAIVFGPDNEYVRYAGLAIGLRLAWPWWKHFLPRRKTGDPVLDHWRRLWWEIRDYPELKQALGPTDLIAANGDMDCPELIGETFLGRGKKENVAQMRSEIADALGLKTHNVRIEIPGEARRFKVIIRKEKALDTPRGWDDSELPRSAREAAVLGRLERGGLLKVVLSGTHTYLFGSTQWGKSTALQSILKSLTATYDTLIFVIDLKGGSFVTPWLKCVDWPATTIDEAMRMLDDVNRMIDNRGGGYAGRKSLLGTPEAPFIAIIWDEAAEGLGSRGSPALQAKWESFVARGAGEGAFSASATHEGSLDSTGNAKIRVNHLNTLHFRSRDRSDGQYGLDDYKNLDVSKIKDKGAFYFHGQSITPGLTGDHPDLCRPPLIRGTPDDGPADEYACDIAERHWDRRPVLDGITREGTLYYDTRWHRQPERIRQMAGIRIAGQPAPNPAAQPVPDAGGGETGLEHDLYSGTRSFAHERAREAEAEAHAVGDGITAADLAAMRQAGRVGELTQQVVRDAVDQFAFDLASGGAAGRRPVDLYRRKNPGSDEPERRAKSWVMENLKDLKEQGHLEQVEETGRYRPVNWQNQVKAYEDLKAALRAEVAAT